MKKQLTFAVIVLAIVAISIAVTDWRRNNFKPEDRSVSDPKAAIAIAVDVWTRIYGAKKIAAEKPYRANLEGDVWRVEGSLRVSPTDVDDRIIHIDSASPKTHRVVVVGGVATAIISKTNGQVLSVYHTK